MILPHYEIPESRKIKDIIQESARQMVILQVRIFIGIGQQDNITDALHDVLYGAVLKLNK